MDWKVLELKAPTRFGSVLQGAPVFAAGCSPLRLSPYLDAEPGLLHLHIEQHPDSTAALKVPRHTHGVTVAPGRATVGFEITPGTALRG